jgi:hypothetical protein
MDAIREGCRNFDFSEAMVRARLHSGRDGFMRAEVRKLFAQFPLLLDTSMSKDKTIWGTLVPFKFAVRPQASGDVNVELSHVVEVAPAEPPDGAAGGGAAGAGAGGGAGGAGDSMSVLVLTARKPHVSIIVDKVRIMLCPPPPLLLLSSLVLSCLGCLSLSPSIAACLHDV